MHDQPSYTARERTWLWAIALFGLVIVNGCFLYGLLLDEDAMSAAISNPVSAAFMLEAVVLTGMMAYLMTRWKVARLSWKWLVGLSLLGGLAFAIPVVTLWRRPKDRNGPRDETSRRHPSTRYERISSQET